MKPWSWTVWTGLGVWLLALATTPLVAQPPQPQAPVYIEDSPAAQDLIDEAAHLRRQDRLAEAAARYQQVVEQYAQKLMAVSPQLYTDMSRWVRGQLLSDAALLAAYRRAYEATAQRALQQAGEPTPDASALASVTRRFALCSAGLEAGLRLAGLCLVRGDGVEAAAVLDDLHGHPDLPAHMARWHQLQAMAGVVSRQSARQARHTSALRASGDGAAQEQLARWTADLQPPATPMADTADLALPKPVPRPLWTVGAGDGPQDPEAAQEQRETMLLTSSEGRIYVNDGMGIMALDRSSGRVLWQHKISEDEVTPVVMNPLMRLGVLDPRGVAIDGSTLAAVLGRASLRQMANRGQPTQLVCLNADGSPRWQRSPGQLDETLANTFLHGTPIVAHGRVYALARRSQMSGFQDAFLLAVDAGSGGLLWRRHLSSSVITNRLGAQMLSQMTMADGVIYVADNLGSAACVSARDGEIRWLAILGEGGAAAREQGLTGQVDSHGTGPIRVEAGILVFAVGTSVLALDPDTGKTLRELKEPLSSSQYLLQAGPHVLGVGSTVSLLDGGTLEVRWRRRVAASEELNVPVGRGVVVGQRLLLPLRSRMVVIELRDGTIVGEYPSDGPGNVLVLPGQIVQASRGSIRCFMAWEDAQQSLQAQIKAAPTEPDPALAMAHLALSGGRYEAMLQSVDAALAALARHRRDDPPTSGPDPVQERVFGQVMGFTQTASLTQEMRRGLFDRLATITAGPADEVAYQLAFGKFMEESGQIPAAVDHYQSVLSDPVLARQLYRQPHGARQAGLEAALRLRVLVKQHGRELYATHETLARQRLALLRADPSATVASFVDLSRQFPLSDVAPAALSEAAARLRQAGDLKQALSLLRRAYGQTQSDPQVLARVVGQIVASYQELNQPRQARRWLRRGAREHPSLQPLRDGQPVAVDQWLSELATRIDSDGHLPSLSPPLRQPRLINGRLLLPQFSSGESGTDAVITVSGPQVQYRRAPAFEVAWQVSLPDPQVQLLSLTARQTLLWSPATATLTAIQNATGEVAWPAVDARELLKELGGEAERQAARPIEQRRFIEMLNPMGQVIRNGKVEPLHQPPPPGHLVAANEQVICVADLGGRTVGISRDTGQILWRFICQMDELSFMQMSEDSLAMAGLMDPRTHEQSGVVLVLDPLTGEPRLPAIDDRFSPVWLGLGGDGLLLYATANQVVALNLDDGELAWRLAAPGNAITGQGFVGFDSMIIRQEGERVQGEDVLLVIDPLAGELVERFHVQLRAEEALDLRPVEDFWHLLSERQVLALDGRGRLVWRDAIGEPFQTLLLQLLGDRHQVVVALQDTPVRRQLQRRLEVIERVEGGELRVHGGFRAVPDGEAPAQESWEYQVYILDRRGGSILEQQALQLGPLREPLDPRRGLFMDHFLLLGAGQHTVVIPDSSSGGGR